MVRSVISGLDHDRGADGHEDQLAYWAAAFDRAAHQNPEASVALYALGNADLLASATGEIVDRLTDWGLIAPEAECLDIGCGIGRFEAALAGRLRTIVGIDISGAMVETARQRTAALPNVEIRQVTGRDLAGFSDRSFDLVLAVDVFPYLVQSGESLLDSMLVEIARVLRHGGQSLVVNFSYRGDLEADRADVQRLAGRSGLKVVRNGTADFRFWDGVTFVIQKP
ncbi:MAG: class I SAM-dependent methyltransferase [Rhizobiales bacterium]|nr:class I SAM-dependent methyltransferase [Hyphomicrobiales bacterium]